MKLLSNVDKHEVTIAMLINMKLLSNVTKHEVTAIVKRQSYIAMLIEDINYNLFLFRKGNVKKC